MLKALSQIDPRKLKRVVIKIGSNVLTDHDRIRKGFFRELAEQVSFLRKKNIAPIIVSSGAIAAAMSSFKKTKKPKTIPEMQAYAAIGQPLLMNHYAQEFKKKQMLVGQILLTHEGLDDRVRFLNAKHALNCLLKNGVAF